MFSIFKSKKEESFNAFDAADEWFINEGINKSTIRFSVYSDPDLVRNSGASAIVGFGNNLNGKSVAFVVEVVRGSGVVEACISSDLI